MGLGESFADAANALHRPPASKLSPVDRSAIATILLFSVFAIFATIGLHGMTDAKYSMLVSENLMQHHSFAMDARSMPQLPPFSRPGYGKSGYPYQIEVKNGKVLYWYPVGTSLLSLPFVAFMNMAGVSAHTADGGYDETGEDNIQEILAAFLMATLAVIFFRTALLLLPVSWSVVLALGGVFSTQIWSTASRVLWSHTWQIFLIGLALYMLLAQEEGALGSHRNHLVVIVRGLFIEGLRYSFAGILPFSPKFRTAVRRSCRKSYKSIERIVRICTRCGVRTMAGRSLLAHAVPSAAGFSGIKCYRGSYAGGLDGSKLVGRSLLWRKDDDRYRALVLPVGGLRWQMFGG